MIDRDSGKLVLIDFCMAQRVAAGRSAADDFTNLFKFLDHHGKSRG